MTKDPLITAISGATVQLIDVTYSFASLRSGKVYKRGSLRMSWVGQVAKGDRAKP